MANRHDPVKLAIANRVFESMKGTNDEMVANRIFVGDGVGLLAFGYKYEDSYTMLVDVRTSDGGTRRFEIRVKEVMSG